MEKLLATFRKKFLQKTPYAIALLVEPSPQENILEYKKVTAYTATRPVIVNGIDINTGVYPVLNYKPENATDPYIYVPIAEFKRVGAKVVWDEQKQILKVTTDYYELQQKIAQLKKQLGK